MIPNGFAQLMDLAPTRFFARYCCFEFSVWLETRRVCQKRTTPLAKPRRQREERVLSGFLRLADRERTTRFSLFSSLSLFSSTRESAADRERDLPFSRAELPRTSTADSGESGLYSPWACEEAREGGGASAAINVEKHARRLTGGDPRRGSFVCMLQTPSIMASQKKSKFRSILDYHVRDPLLDEVKDAISSMIAQFEQEHITSFISGLENLVVGIAKHFPSDFRNSCGGVHGTMKEVNMVRDDNPIHMDGADAQGVIDKHKSQQDCPSNNKRKRIFSTEECDSNRSAVFYHRRRISRAQTQAQDQVGIDEAQPPVVNCGSGGINQVQIAVNQDSHGSIPDVADKDSRNAYVDKRIPACENVDASTSKQYGQTHNLNQDNNRRKDNSPSVVKSFNVSKGHTDQSPLRDVCGLEG